MKRSQNDLSSGVTLSSVQFFNALNKYIPSLVLQSWMEKQKLKMIDQEKHIRSGSKYTAPTQSEQLPYIQDMETVVLFADISGFTNISEACASHGIRGNEELAFCINRYMEGMVKNLAKFGGDIIKFVGDAMIVMWPRGGGKYDEDDDKVNVIRKAIQCAFDIQKELNNKKIMANVTNLSVKIGIGFGSCALLYVGGVFDRSEFFTVGTALTNALASEEQATAGGQILVSETAFKHVKNQYYEGTEIVAKDGKRFYRVTRVKEGVRGRADAVLLKSQIKIDRIAGIQKNLKSCVPAAIMPYLEIGYEQFGSETRALTVMFASLGVDLSSASSQSGMNKIQQIVTTVQQQVYRLEGSLNKLVMDDKGSTLICIWGLCPIAHIDDPQRAILTAMNMKRALNEIEGTWCNVGIATGDVFSGVVGTSGSRKEFSVLGDVVNLAARIMFWPLKTGDHGKINVCMRTKNEAMNTISFKYGAHCEFKGKSISIPIFEPIDPDDEFNHRDKITPPQCYLKLHYNPLIVQKQVNHKRYSPLIGKQGFINEMYDEIKRFLFKMPTRKNHEDQENLPLSIIIHGESGVGKTHLARAICEKIQKESVHILEQFSGMQQRQAKNSSFNRSKQTLDRSLSMNNKENCFPIFASTLNAESRMKFLGAWRPILRNMIEQSRKITGLSKLKLLKQLIQGQHDKVDIILDIFGYNQDEEEFRYLKKQLNESNLPQETSIHKQNPYGFLMREKYENQAIDEVLNLFVDFIKKYIGEFDDENSSSLEESEYQSDGENSSNKKLVTKMPCILFFDHATIMDEESYCLLLRVHQSCSNICVVMILLQDSNGNMLKPQLEKKKQTDLSANQYWQGEQYIIDQFYQQSKIYDMQQLQKRDLMKLLLEMAPKYQQSYQEEISLMTEIKDPKTSIKTVEKSDEWLKILTRQYNLDKVFCSVDEDIVELIVKKCDGNALLCLQFFFNLLLNGFIEIGRDQNVTKKKTLDLCLAMNNFTKIPVPSLVHKRRLKDLDSFLKTLRQKNNTRKQELGIKGLMLMKAAAIIGDEFGTAALKKILPLRNESHGSIRQILTELELFNLIEILDETDPKDVLCRFNKVFLRESIYQIMLYRDQKKVLHQQLAEYLQSLPSPVMDQQQIDLEIMKLRDHILIGEDIKSEKNLPFKHMQGLIVKQMQALLIKNNNRIVLYKGFVLKQGKSASKKISKRLMILSPKEITWFHSVEEYESNATPLGMIRLEDVNKCQETTMQSNTYDFDIQVSSYIKKGQIDNSARVIKFGCETENDRHQWISRIEFLKAKAVYENYVNKFVNIQFPLKKIEDFEDDAEQMNDAIYEKLSQFGKNFKGFARINHQILQQRPMLTHQGSGMYQQNRSSNTNISKLRKRGSIISRVSLNMDNESNENQAYKQSNILSAQELSKKIANLYNATIVCVFNQTTVNSNKSQYQGQSKKPIGKLPEYFQPDFIDEPVNQTYNSTSTPRMKNSERRSKELEKGPPSLKTPANIHQINEQSEGSSSHVSNSPMKKDDYKARMQSQTKTEKKRGSNLQVKDLGKQKEGAKRRFQQRQSERISFEQAQRIANDLQKQTQISGVGNESQGQTSGNSANQVSKQLQMLDDHKSSNPKLREDRGFTFNKKDRPDEKNNSIPKSSHIRQNSGGKFPYQENDLSQAVHQNIHNRGQSLTQVVSQTQRHFPNANNSSLLDGISSINEDIVGGFNQSKVNDVHFSIDKHDQYPYKTRFIQEGFDSSKLNSQSVSENFSPYGATEQLPTNLKPMIQQEINKQINIGLRQFFSNLDRKLEEQSHYSISKSPQEDISHNMRVNNLSMKKLFDESFMRQQDSINDPRMQRHHQSAKEIQIIKPSSYKVRDQDRTPTQQRIIIEYPNQNKKHLRQEMLMQNTVQSKQTSLMGSEEDDDDEPDDPFIDYDKKRVHYKNNNYY